MGHHAVWARLVASVLLMAIGVFVVVVGAGFEEFLGMLICVIGGWNLAAIATGGDR